MNIEWRRLGDIPRGWYFRLNADDPRWRLLNTEATWLWDKDAKVLSRPPDRSAMSIETLSCAACGEPIDTTERHWQRASTDGESYAWHAACVDTTAGPSTRISPPPG